MYEWVDVSVSVFRVFSVLCECCVVVVFVWVCITIFLLLLLLALLPLLLLCFCFVNAIAIGSQFTVTQGCISSAQMVALWTPTLGLQTMPQCHGVLPSKRARNSPLRGRGRPSRIVCTGSAMLDSDPCSKFSLRSMSLQRSKMQKVNIEVQLGSKLYKKSIHRYLNPSRCIDILPSSTPVWLTHLCSHRLRRPMHWPPP